MQKEIMERKEQQIRNILLEDDITYGMAKSIIQRVEADLLKEGDMYLSRTKLRHISPEGTTNHR